MTRFLTRRELFTVLGMSIPIGLGIAIGADTLEQRHLWPFQRNLAGTRSPFPHASSTGKVKTYTFEAAPATIPIGDTSVHTWAFNGAIPGPELRVTEGDTLRVLLQNRLPENASIHWHGVPLVNAMDGVPGATQQPVTPGAQFLYDFVVPTAGTYFYHSHVGLQLDRGLYGPLIVSPAQEPDSYDQDTVLVLDDWLDGLPGTPDATMKKLIANGDRMNMGSMMNMQVPPDVLYPKYLINGKTAEQPMEVVVKNGQRVRLRFVNAAAATIFHVALQGHRFTVTHTDGQPVEPVEVDVLRIGMGERYDVLVTANNPGVWQLATRVEGAPLQGRALFRYQGNASQVPPATFAPPELNHQMLQYTHLKAAPGLIVPPIDTPDQVLPIQLTGGMGHYVWEINNQVFNQADLIEIPKNSLIQFRYKNTSMMPHPMHLHGHFFQLDNGTGRGPLKDTVLVDPQQTVVTNWISDNPGMWAYHCHNVYHQMAGMMRYVNVR